MKFLRRALLVTVVGLLSACAGNRGIPASMLGWNRPFPAFKIAGNVHYVGTEKMAIFLITTPQGHILLDSGFEAKVPQLKASVESLGFRFEDIKILLASHAHIDHVQGHAEVRKLTGAKVYASAEDAEVIRTGGKNEWAYGDAFSWTPCPVDEIVRDGQRIDLGGTTLVARFTPGHTRGATTWTMNVSDPALSKKSSLAVVFFSSASVPPGAKLVDNPAYPDAVAAYKKSFARWKALPCDVFLGSHSEFFDLARKYDARKDGQGGKPDPFLDPGGYQRAIADWEKKFLAHVDSES
ncbi:MAG TPA: subclass B3 metallo-beta-lactamase [Polyangia bacterium]